MWYTLIRFKKPEADGSGDSQSRSAATALDNLAGVSQAKTAADALKQLETWEREYPDHTTVVFDPKNAPVQRRTLLDAAAQTA